MGCKPPTAEGPRLPEAGGPQSRTRGWQGNNVAHDEGRGAAQPPSRERETASQNGFSQNVNSGIMFV